MLIPETPFPQAGSYALICDTDSDPHAGHELVRLQRLPAFAGDLVLVAFPLRSDASGIKRVPFEQLIDASPLTPQEQREFHDLDRELFSREDSIRRWDGEGSKPRLTKVQRAKAARRDELRQRIIAGPIIDRLLRRARFRDAQRKKAA